MNLPDTRRSFFTRMAAGVQDLCRDGTDILDIDVRGHDWGALVGWFPVDRVTLAFLRERAMVLRSQGVGDRLTDDDFAAWEAAPPRSDTDAVYAAEIVLGLSCSQFSFPR